MHQSLLYITEKTTSRYLVALASYLKITEHEKTVQYFVRWASKG